MRILSLDLSTKFLYQPGVNNLQQFQGLHVVYLIIFPNNKMYCGYSSNISQRWTHGISAYKSCNLVYRAFQKYGWDNENIKKYIIFSSADKQQALNKEKETIKELDLLNHEKGYNLVEGGNVPPSWTGKHHTEETKELLSEKIKEKWQDPIFAGKMRQKMLEASKENNRNIKFSPLERKQIWGKHNLGRKPPNAKTILQIDLQTHEILNEHSSARQAALALGLDPTAGSNIQRTARGIGRSAYGYGWRWKDETFDN